MILLINFFLFTINFTNYSLFIPIFIPILLLLLLLLLLLIAPKCNDTSIGTRCNKYSKLATVTAVPLNSTFNILADRCSMSLPILIHALATNFYNSGMAIISLMDLNLTLDYEISNILNVLFDGPYANTRDGLFRSRIKLPMNFDVDSIIMFFFVT